MERCTTVLYYCTVLYIRTGLPRSLGALLCWLRWKGTTVLYISRTAQKSRRALVLVAMVGANLDPSSWFISDGRLSYTALAAALLPQAALVGLIAALRLPKLLTARSLSAGGVSSASLLGGGGGSPTADHQPPPPIRGLIHSACCILISAAYALLLYCLMTDAGELLGDGDGGPLPSAVLFSACWSVGFLMWIGCLLIVIAERRAGKVPRPPRPQPPTPPYPLCPSLSPCQASSPNPPTSLSTHPTPPTHSTLDAPSAPSSSATLRLRSPSSALT